MRQRQTITERKSGETRTRDEPGLCCEELRSMNFVETSGFGQIRGQKSVVAQCLSRHVCSRIKEENDGVSLI